MPKEKLPISCPRCGNSRKPPERNPYVERLDADGSLHCDCSSCGYLMVWKTGVGFRRLVSQNEPAAHLIPVGERTN